MILYSDYYENNGTISASGVNATTARFGGGASGGGSINILYNVLESEGTVKINGGLAKGTDNKGGAGGNGTVTYTQIAMPIQSIQSTLTVNEVAENVSSIVQSILPPSIKIDTVENTATKKIDITYAEGYINEYSLDLGKTWQIHTGTITVDKPTTVITRIIDGEGEVLSSSSLTITTIDNTDSEVIEEENTGIETTNPENTEEQPEVTVNEESITKEETEEGVENE